MTSMRGGEGERQKMSFAIRVGMPFILEKQDPRTGAFNPPTPQARELKVVRAGSELNFAISCHILSLCVWVGVYQTCSGSP